MGVLMDAKSAGSTEKEERVSSAALFAAKWPPLDTTLEQPHEKNSCNYIKGTSGVSNDTCHIGKMGPRRRRGWLSLPTNPYSLRKSGVLLLAYTVKTLGGKSRSNVEQFSRIRIFQRNGLKLDKDLIFSGLVQNVYVYRMAKSKKI